MRRIIFLSTLQIFAQPAFAQTSSEHRIEKPFIAVAEPISFTPYPGGGVRGGYHLDDRLAFETAYTSSASNFGGGSSRFIFSQIDTLGRFYVGNSFNVSGGLAYQQIRINFRHDPDSDNRFPVTAKSRTLGLRAAIGNRWQLNHVTIGCDWVGGLLPITRLGPESVQGESRVDASERARIDDEIESETFAERLTLLRFHIGAAF